MVSFKSLTVLALSISAAAAVPQFGHARFHKRISTGADLDLPETHSHGHDANDTENEVAIQLPAPVVSADAAAISGPARRWDHTRQGGWGGQNTWTQPAAQPSAPAVGISVGLGGSQTTSAADGGYTAAPVTGSTGGKKGLSYNNNGLLTQFSSAGASWAYNWASSAGGAVPAGVEYVPMCWGTKSLGQWSKDVNTAISNGATHVLSFNEPDFPEQANIAPAQAAQLHIANVGSLSGKVKVGSPAITNSNIAGQGLDWMKSFLAACGGASNNCKIDFLAFHWYNNPGTMDNFKSHVSSVISLAKANGIPKVWLTEFAVNGGTADQAAFLKEALPFLDSQPEVERYAYFMVGEGQMLSSGALNVVGKAYSS